MRRRTILALTALGAAALGGCVNDAPYPVTGLAVTSDLPPLPPPNYGASAAPASRSARRVTYRARATLTDDQIRIRILQAAVAACVPDSPCVCPAVTPEMIADWRRQHGA